MHIYTNAMLLQCIHCKHNWTFVKPSWIQAPMSVIFHCAAYILYVYATLHTRTFGQLQFAYIRAMYSQCRNVHCFYTAASVWYQPRGDVFSY